MPCSGTVQSGVLKYNYDSSNSCGAAEQFAWRMAGEDLARSVGVVCGCVAGTVGMHWCITPVTIPCMRPAPERACRTQPYLHPLPAPSRPLCPLLQLGYGPEMDSTQRRRLVVVLPTSVRESGRRREARGLQAVRVHRHPGA